MNDLTDKQKECLIIINLLTKKYGYSPTVREIARELGNSQQFLLYVHYNSCKLAGVTCL